MTPLPAAINPSDLILSSRAAHARRVERLADLERLRTTARTALAEFREALATDGEAFVDAYAEHVLFSGSHGVGPRRPSSLHPKVSEVLRDLVLDEATVLRMSRSGR